MKRKNLEKLVETADVIIHEFNTMCNGFEQTIVNLQNENSALKKELNTNTSAQAYSLLKMEFEKVKIQSAVEYTDLEKELCEISKKDPYLKIKRLKELLSERSAEFIALQIYNESLQSKNEQLKKALEFGDSKGNAEQANQITELKREIDKLTAFNVNEVVSNLLKEINENKYSKINFNNSGEISMEFGNDTQQIESQNQRLISINKDINKRNAQLNKDLYELNESLEQKDAVISNLQKTIKEIDFIHTRGLEKNADVCVERNERETNLRNRISELEIFVSDLEGLIEQKDKVIEHLQGKYDAVLERFNTLQRNYSISDIQFLRSKVTDLQSEVFELTKEKDNYYNLYNKINSQNADLKRELQNTQKTCYIRDLVRENKTFRNEKKHYIEVFQQTQSMLEKRLQELNKENSELIKEIEMLQVIKNSSQNRVNYLVSEMEKLQKTVDYYKDNSAYKAKCTEIERINKELDSANNVYGENLDLKSEIENLKSNPRNNEYTRNLELANKNLIETNKQFDKSNKILIEELNKFKENYRFLTPCEFNEKFTINDFK